MRVDQIEIHTGAVDFQYEPMRRLEVKCEARTNFSKSPTITDANAKLQELAVKLGANAVIDVQYDSGMSMTSWRSMKATGLAVKKVSDEIQCPQCAETIKRAAKVCRFCGAQVAGGAAATAAVGVRADSTRGANTPSPTRPRPNVVPDEPLRATDNSQVGIVIAVVVAVLIAVLAALS